MDASARRPESKFSSGASALWDEMIATDLSEQALNAPLKGFYTFSESAHSPIFEEPERAQKILREDVLERSTHLAD